MEIIVATGGGFDPLHKGHIRLLKEAKNLGDKLVVILSSDEQLKMKNGRIFYPSQEERKEILESIKYVDEVFIDSNTQTTCENALRLIHPDIYAKGGDRTSNNMAKVELDVCKELGIKIVYGVGGGKVQSSSWLIKGIFK
jgi:cytidyltransferase-like protein